eukprot:gene55134-23918_t
MKPFTCTIAPGSARPDPGTQFDGSCYSCSHLTANRNGWGGDYSIDDDAFWSRALSAGELRDVITRGVSCPHAPTHAPTARRTLL